MSVKSFRNCFAVFAVIALLFCAGISRAQAVTADITGSVTDSSGAVLPGAKVTLQNVGTNATQTQQAGASGDYTFTLLPTGTYSIKVEAQGFKTFSAPAVSVSAGDRARVDAKMEVGEVSQTVEVKGEVTAALQTDSATVGGLVTSEATQDVPLNGRNPTNLVQLVPGANEGGQGGGPQRPDDRRATSSVVVNGQNGGNNWLLDGIDNNERSIGTVIVKPSIDAIQEIKVDTNLYSASQGRAGGGVINIVTKSGTNSYHGTAYEFLRNQMTDAKNFFNNPVAGNPLAGVKPPYHQNQFGGSLGGPVVKDKMFFFADYEDLRTIQGLTQLVAVPSACELGRATCNGTTQLGNFSDLIAPGYNCAAVAATGCVYDTWTTPSTPIWFPGNVVPLAQISTVSQNYAKLYPTVSTCSTPLSCTYVSSPAYSQYSKTGDARVDYRFNDKDSIFGRYTINEVTSNWPSFIPNVTINGLSVVGGGEPNVGGGGGAFFPSTSSQRAQSFTLGYTHIFRPNLLFQFNSSIGRYVSASQAPQSNIAVNNVAIGGPANVNIIQGSGLLPGTGGLGIVQMAGYALLGKQFALPTNYFDTNYYFGGTLTWTKGSHSVKFGTSILRRDWSAFQTLTPINFTFATNQTAKAGVGGNAFASMLGGVPNSIAQNMALIAPQYRDWEIGHFVQDDWRATRWLTVNLGLRYDIFTPIQEKHNLISNFDPTVPSILTGGQIQVAGVNGVGETLGVQTQWNMFQPRIGFAATMGRGMVLRGGFGMSFWPGNTASPANLKNAPFVSVYTRNPTSPTDAAGNFTVAAPPIAPAPTCVIAACGATPNITIADAQAQNYRNSTVYMYNLAVQKQLAQYVITVGYVGEQARYLPQVIPNLDLPLPPNGPGGCGRTTAAGPFQGAITLGLNQSGTNGPCQPFSASLPYLNSIQFLRSNGHNNYNGVQFIFERRFSGGLTISANYVYSHMLSDVAGSGGACGTCGLVLNNAHYDWGNGDVNSPHRVAATVNYQLPFGKSYTGVKGQIVKGWQINGLYSYEHGLPFTVANGSNQQQWSSKGQSDRPNVLPRQPFTQSINEWFNIADFQLQAPGTAGNEARTQFYNPPAKRFDMSLFKNFQIRESVTLQFRTEVFNLANNPTFSAPGSTINAWSGGVPTNAGNFGKITATNSFYTPRQFQFALKLMF